VSDADLRQALHEAVGDSSLPHVRRMSLAAAIVSTALERAGMEATLVGGSAIEFYVTGSYTTADIDFIVERATREKLAEVFAALGMQRKDRHWYVGDLYFEVPSFRREDPALTFEVGPFTLRVIAREVVLAERITGFKYWKYWGYGLQAVDMIRTFRHLIDEEALRNWLKREQAEDAYDLLCDVADSGRELTEREMGEIWQSRFG
jgi:hypothetical protein